MGQRSKHLLGHAEKLYPHLKTNAQNCKSKCLNVNTNQTLFFQGYRCNFKADPLQDCVTWIFLIIQSKVNELLIPSDVCCVLEFHLAKKIPILAITLNKWLFSSGSDKSITNPMALKRGRLETLKNMKPLHASKNCKEADQFWAVLH